MSASSTIGTTAIMKNNDNGSRGKNQIIEKIVSRKKVSREWLDAHGFIPLKEVRKSIEGSNYVG